MMEEKRKVFQVTTDDFVYLVFALHMVDAVSFVFNSLDEDIKECILVDPKGEVILDEDNEGDDITLAEYIDRDIVVSNRPVILATKENDYD